MDPLSVTASVLTIVGIAMQVSKSLAKVRAIHYAPAELSSLINEVSDLRAIISQVASFSNQLEEEKFKGPVVALKSHLDRAIDQLRALDNLTNTKLLKIRSNGTTRISRLAWSRLSPDVDLMRRELRSNRVNIGTALGIVTSSTMSRVELKVVDISSQMSSWRGEQQATTALLTEIATQVRGNTRTDSAPIFGESNLFPISSIARLREYGILQTMNQQNPQPDNNTVCIRTEMRPYGSCKIWCSCCCHAQHSVRFPRVLKNMMGSLFIGYSGLPILTAPCSEKTCSKRSSPSMHVSYYFPTWFLSRVLNFNASFNAFKGPQLNLHVPRLVGWSHPLWRLAHADQVISIQKLFDENLASPFDVNAYGQSALHYAATNGRTECSRFLIQQGADMYLKDENGRKPIDSAWDLVLGNHMKPDETDTFLHVFARGDYTETRQFSVLHKIVLGIYQDSLTSRLAASTTGIDDVDANNRSSLSWAAARRDDTAAKILLDHGANLEIRDFEGNTALTQAVRSSHLPTIRLLLEYGADTNKRDAYGGTVLHQACVMKDDPAILEPLIAAHVDINAIDYDGDTALQYTVRQNHIKNTQYLLESNADPEIANVGGDTPILMAIFYQADQILQTLLDHNANYRIISVYQQTILHVAACEGTPLILRTLADAHLSGLDVLAKDSENKTCLECFQKRGNADSALQSAFDQLISSVFRENNLVQQSDMVAVGDDDGESDEYTDAVESQSVIESYHEISAPSTGTTALAS